MSANNYSEWRYCITYYCDFFFFWLHCCFILPCVLSNEVFSVMTYSNAATNGYFHYWLNWPILFLMNCLVYKMLENKTWMKIPFSFSQSLRWLWQIACVVKPTAQILLFTLTLKWWRNSKVLLCLEKKKSLAIIFFQLLQLYYRVVFYCTIPCLHSERTWRHEQKDSISDKY